MPQQTTPCYTVCNREGDLYKVHSWAIWLPFREYSEWPVEKNRKRTEESSVWHHRYTQVRNAGTAAGMDWDPGSK